MTTPAETVAAYDALMERALKIVDVVYNAEHARLHVADDGCRVTWLAMQSGYGDQWVETETSVPFPLDLLLMPDVAFAGWLATRKAAQEKVWAAGRRRAEAEREMQERELLAALQKKYSGIS